MLTVTEVEIRSGAYYDSVILMQLQRSLVELPGILDAGVVMGTEANKELLAQSDLLSPEVETAVADDLVIVVKGRDQASAKGAIEKVDELLTSRRRAGIEQEYLPKSLETAVKILPEAQWVLVSVPGRFAAGVARQSLHLGKHVFIFSDNVSLEDEIELKRTAAKEGLLVMGPDCGTAIVNGVGFGFANKVHPGPIGIVAASGTGLQQVSSRIHQLGSGVTQAIGTGGRDLSEAVNAITAHQALELLSRDPDTKVIVFISKPPSPKVADQLVQTVRELGKPVVLNFIGYSTSLRVVDRVYFATTFDETAELAVQLAKSPSLPEAASDLSVGRFATEQRYLRGLFSGGTLAYEALLILQNYLPAVYSNVPLDKEFRLGDSLVSQAHTVIDLGEDEFTVGRLHPMMDNDLRIRRLEKEANDPQVAIILLDVVLGYGAHPNPAGELAAAIAKVKAMAKTAGRYLEVVAVVCGTDEDPQDLNAQIKQLKDAGVVVETSNDKAIRYAGQLARALDPDVSQPSPGPSELVDLEVYKQPLAAINVGLETFKESLVSQNAQAIQVDWRPPASGNEKLMAILERMKNK
ncbi:MAG TPA: acyl-CoA synthetase FdrA [Anaerolineales bacterium]|nr:acyl-CoA synthetase FdrA [Anaerolineales bacterium]